MIIGSNQVMEKSNMTSRFDNSDHDGDSLIALALHSSQAKEDFKYAYVRNLVEFEHMDELLMDYEHEAIYASFMLAKMADENRFPFVGITTQEDFKLKEEKFNLNYISEHPGSTKNYAPFGLLTIVEAAINQVLCQPFLDIDPNFFDEPLYLISRDGLLNKKNLTKLTERFWNSILKINEGKEKDILNFWDIIHEFDKFLLECSAGITYCIPSFDLKDFAVQSDEITEFKKNLIQVEPFLAFHQNLVLFEKVSEEIAKNESNILNLVFKSGARLKSVQLLKAASNTGIPTDIYGKSFPVNIKNSLLDGLTQEEYFIAGDSARLALAQRQEAIPKGGELQRKFFFTIGILKLAPEVENCQSDIPLVDQKTYPITIKSWSHLKLMNHRYYRDYRDTDTLNPIQEVFIMETDSTDENIINEHKKLVGRTIEFYSPVTCQCKDYTICKQCFGNKLPESINLGSTVGAALSEGIIQSVLRTHHFGGAFIAKEDYKLMEIMRRAKFEAPDSIISTKEDINYIIEYLQGIYQEEEWEHRLMDMGPDEVLLKIIIYELPFNDDSVKVLNGIVSLIDRNRSGVDLIEPSDLYDKLEHVIEQNGILSTYLELVISLLYYDEDGTLLRYSDKKVDNQVALKNIIEILDPKLGIFYNFSNRIISKIYNRDVKEPVDHMYNDLIDVYR